MYSVRVGSDRWSKGGQRLQVKSLYIHHSYIGGPSYENDIALLPLTSEIIFDGVTVAPIPLAQSGAVMEAGIIGFVSGWGLVRHYDFNQLLYPVRVCPFYVPCFNSVLLYFTIDTVFADLISSISTCSIM